MIAANLKKLAFVAVFAAVAIAALIIFGILNPQRQQAATPVLQGAVQEAAQKAAQASPSQGFLQNLFCSKYSNLPLDIAPCTQAYNAATAYAPNIESLQLIGQREDGTFIPATPLEVSEPPAAVKRWLWYAAFEAEEQHPENLTNPASKVKVVLFDAKDLSVVKATP